MLPYWVQQGDEQAFPKLLWSRPETKHAAGKLLVVGGYAQSFAAPAEAYTTALSAGIGETRVLLPDSLEKTVSKLFPEASFAPSNPSGGFSSGALAEVLSESEWSDGVLLAGDLGRNSETMAMLENFAGKYTGLLAITKDTADFFCTHPTGLLARPDTLLVVTTAQLQRLATSLQYHHAFTSDLGLLQIVELLHEFTTAHRALFILTRHQDSYIIAREGQVSTTHVPSDEPIWRVKRAAAAVTWWLQNPTKPFEAATSSVTPTPKH